MYVFKNHCNKKKTTEINDDILFVHRICGIRANVLFTFCIFNYNHNIPVIFETLSLLSPLFCTYNLRHSRKCLFTFRIFNYNLNILLIFALHEHTLTSYPLPTHIYVLDGSVHFREAKKLYYKC